MPVLVTLNLSMAGLAVQPGYWVGLGGERDWNHRLQAEPQPGQTTGCFPQCAVIAGGHGRAPRQKAARNVPFCCRTAQQKAAAAIAGDAIIR